MYVSTVFYDGLVNVLGYTGFSSTLLCIKWLMMTNKDTAYIYKGTASSCYTDLEVDLEISPQCLRCSIFIKFSYGVLVR